MVSFWFINWVSLLEKLILIFFALKVKGITMVFQDWKCAKASSLHVFLSGRPWMSSFWWINWLALLENLHVNRFMLKVKGITKVCQAWKSANAFTLHVLFVRPTVNEPFWMNKLACTFFVNEVSFENDVKMLEFSYFVKKC